MIWTCGNTHNLYGALALIKADNNVCVCLFVGWYLFNNVIFMKIWSEMDIYFSKDFGEFLDGRRISEVGGNIICQC